MRISVIGAGGIGSAIAAYCSRAGNEVALVFKERQEAEAVRANGLCIKGTQSFTTRVHVVEWPDPIPPSDLLIVAVKSYDTREALHCTRGVSVDVAMSVQNGLQKEEVLSEFVRPASVIGALVEITAMNEGRGFIFNPDTSMSHVGELDGHESDRITEILRVMNQAGIPTTSSRAIRSFEWTKACQWIATSLLSVMTGYPYPQIFTAECLSPLFVEIVRDCAAVAAAEGAHIVEARSLFVNRLVSGSSENACAWLHEKGRQLATSWGVSYKASMLLDVERHSKTEFDDVVGYVLGKARQHQIETAALDFAVRQVCKHIGSALETRFGASSGTSV